MESMQWEITDRQAYDQVAADLLDRLGQPPVPLLLYGDLGAGKTTLVQALCRRLGVTEAVTSPTFALVNEYRGATDPVYHLDLYRLADAEEAVGIGVEDYLFSPYYCFVEWPDVLAGLLPADYLSIQLTATADNHRKILLL